MEDPDECFAVMLKARAGLAFTVLEPPAQEPQVSMVVVENTEYVHCMCQVAEVLQTCDMSLPSHQRACSSRRQGGNTEEDAAWLSLPAHSS